MKKKNCFQVSRVLSYSFPGESRTRRKPWERGRGETLETRLVLDILMMFENVLTGEHIFVYFLSFFKKTLDSALFCSRNLYFSKNQA